MLSAIWSNRFLAVRRELLNAFQFLADQLVEQPYVMMHRDYLSANLMVLPNEKTGILDFQDAVWGPPVYDLVSLLRDCYIDGRKHSNQIGRACFRGTIWMAQNRYHQKSFLSGLISQAFSVT